MVSYSNLPLIFAKDWEGTDAMNHEPGDRLE